MKMIQILQYSLVFFLLVNKINAQKGEDFELAMEKADAVKIRRISDRILKINQVLDNNATAAFQAVSETLDMQKVDKATLDKIKLSFSFAKVVAKGVELGLKKIGKDIPVLGTAVTLFSDLYNIQSDLAKQNKQIEAAMQANYIKEILTNIATLRTALFPTDEQYRINRVEKLMVDKFKKEGSSYLSQLEDGIYSYEQKIGDIIIGYDGQERKYQTVAFMVAITEELIEKMHASKIKEGGFFQCNIITYGCNYAEWNENKNNCVFIKNAKYQFVGPLSQQFTKLVNFTKSISKNMINIGDLNIPVTYKVNLPSGGGFYLLQARAGNPKFDTYDIRENADGNTGFGIILVSEESNGVSQNKKLFTPLINRILKAKFINVDQLFYEDINVSSGKVKF